MVDNDFSDHYFDDEFAEISVKGSINNGGADNTRGKESQSEQNSARPVPTVIATAAAVNANEPREEVKNPQEQTSPA